MSNGPAASAEQGGDGAGHGPSTSYPAEGPLRLHATCAGHRKAVSRVRFSPSGQLLASVSADATLRLWSVADGAAVQRLGAATPEKQPAGQAAADAGGRQQGAPHSLGINDVDWNGGGNYLATASDDLTAKIWDAETGACLSTLPGHTNYVFCCQFNPAGNILATGSFDETIRFWDVRSGRCLRELPAHSDPVTAMDFSYDGTVLASCSFDGLLRLWDTSTGHCLKTLAIDNGDHPLSCVTFSPNGRYLLQSCLNSKLRLVSYETGRVVKTYKGHVNTKFCSISTFVTSACDLPGQQQQQQQPGTGPAVAAGSEDGSIFLWDINSKQVLQQVPGRKTGEEQGPGHSGPVLCVASHASQPVLASAGHEPDCTVKIWSVEPHP